MTIIVVLCIYGVKSALSSAEATWDLHTVLPQGGRWPVCLPNWGSEVPQGACSGSHSHISGRRKPYPLLPLPESLLVLSLSWAPAFDILKHYG